MKLKTTLLALTGSALFFTSVSPTLASAAETESIASPVLQSSIGTTNGETIQVEARWKAKVAKEAIESLADLIDSSYIDNIIDAIPSKYRPAFKDSKNDIVSSLRSLARKGDAAEEAVQNAIVQAVMSTGAPSSVANGIANVLVFVFL